MRWALVLACALASCGDDHAGPDGGSGGADAPPADGPGSDARPDDAPSGGDAAGDASTSEGGPPRAIFCETQWPLETTTAAGQPTEMLYVRTRVAGVTPARGLDPALQVEVGFGPAAEPPTSAAWSWQAASYNGLCAGCPGDQDEFMGTLTPPAPGEMLWAGRVRYAGSAPTYCDRADGGRAGSADGFSADTAPRLHVAPPGGLRAVSLNMRCLVDNWDARLPIVADGIAAVDPDFVGLQEVCQGQGRDNLTELAAALGSRTGRSYQTLRAITHLSWNNQYMEGIAVVTPHTIAENQVVALPPGLFPRKLILARIVSPQGPVVFATTHLDNLSARAAEAQTVATALTAFTAPTEAALLAGDFNETPSGGPVHTTLESAELIDLWPALRPGEPGYSFASSGPTARIDYLWLLPNSAGFAPADIALILSQPLGGVYGSDHLGLRGQVSR